MAQVFNNFEEGSDGVAITTGNSGGSGSDAFTQVDVTATYDNDHVYAGALAGKMGDTSGLQWDSSTPIGEQPDIWGEVFLYLTSAPTFHSDFFVSTSGSWGSGGIEILDNLKVRVLDNVTSLFDSTNTIPLDQWVRLVFHCVNEVDGNDGVMEVFIYITGDLTVPDESYSNTTCNTGVGGGAGYDVYALSIDTSAGETWVDDIRFYTEAAPLLEGTWG